MFETNNILTYAWPKVRQKQENVKYSRRARSGDVKNRVKCEKKP